MRERIGESEEREQNWENKAAEGDKHGMGREWCGGEDGINF